jgi:hypothetical protein
MMNSSTKTSQIGMMEMYVPPCIHDLPSDTDDFQDEVLAQAIEKADAEVVRIKQEADAKKWRMVADKMKTIKVSTAVPQTRVMS